MPVFGLPENKRPKKVMDKLGVDSQGGVVSPPQKPPIQEMTMGAPMGSLADRALVNKQEEMNAEFDRPGRANFWNRKYKKEMKNGRLANAASRFGQAEEG